MLQSLPNIPSLPKSKPVADKRRGPKLLAAKNHTPATKPFVYLVAIPVAKHQSPLPNDTRLQKNNSARAHSRLN